MEEGGREEGREGEKGKDRVREEGYGGKTGGREEGGRDGGEG